MASASSEIPPGGAPGAEAFAHSGRNYRSASTGSARSLDGLRREMSGSQLGFTARWSPRVRHAVGWVLLCSVVFMWTASNFLSSYMFADNTYNKPFFVTYCNTAVFIVFLPLLLLPKLATHPEEMRQFAEDVALWRDNLLIYKVIGRRRRVKLAGLEASGELGGSGFLESPRSGLQRLSADEADAPLMDDRRTKSSSQLEPQMLSIAETAALGYRFCWLWFGANFTLATCLEYTTVASGTVLTSLSAVFTLLIGSIMGVEVYTMVKLVGVLMSFFGIFLVYATDLFGNGNDEKHRGDFPEKTFAETLAGDMLALISAVFYGYYACQMKRDCEDESRINMLLFFGFVGLWNVIFLWPFFFILHYIGLETFELPPNTHVFGMVIANAMISGISDMFWASAVLMLSPLMVTVGLSFAIPFSLIMQFVLRHQTPTWLHGVGSTIVLLSVLIVESETKVQQLCLKTKQIWNRNRNHPDAP